MKKLLKDNLKIIVLMLITSVVASATTIFAYSLIAEEVGFTPKDTTWNVENVDAALNNLNLRYNQLDTHYLTDEQVVGEWTDGKPLYQKTVVINNVINNTSWHSVSFSSVGLENVGVVPSINGAYYSAGTYTFINSFRPDVKVGFVLQVDVYQNCILYMNDWLEGGGTIYLTIQYTKTTD